MSIPLGPLRIQCHRISSGLPRPNGWVRLLLPAGGCAGAADWIVISRRGFETDSQAKARSREDRQPRDKVGSHAHGPGRRRETSVGRAVRPLSRQRACHRGRAQGPPGNQGLAARLQSRAFVAFAGLFGGLFRLRAHRLAEAGEHAVCSPPRGTARVLGPAGQRYRCESWLRRSPRCHDAVGSQGQTHRSTLQRRVSLDGIATGHSEGRKPIPEHGHDRVRGRPRVRLTASCAEGAACGRVLRAASELFVLRGNPEVRDGQALGRGAAGGGCRQSMFRRGERGGTLNSAQCMFYCVDGAGLPCRCPILSPRLVQGQDSAARRAESRRTPPRSFHAGPSRHAVGRWLAFAPNVAGTAGSDCAQRKVGSGTRPNMAFLSSHNQSDPDEAMEMAFRRTGGQGRSTEALAEVRAPPAGPLDTAGRSNGINVVCAGLEIARECLSLLWVGGFYDCSAARPGVAGCSGLGQIPCLSPGACELAGGWGQAVAQEHAAGMAVTALKAAHMYHGGPGPKRKRARPTAWRSRAVAPTARPPET